MDNRRFPGKSSIIKLSAIILPVALIALLVTGLTTSAMVSLEPVTNEISLELLGQSEHAGQSVYVIQDTGNGFRRGEKLTWTDSETLCRISVNGQVMNPWVTLAGETGVIQSVYQDGTNIYGSDLIVSTTSGNIWRIDGAGNTRLVTTISGYPQGIATIPENPAKYGDWSGKILVGGINGVHFTGGNGLDGFTFLGITPVDLAVITAGEDFYGIASADGGLWHAHAEAFSGMIGDLLVAEQYTGVLWRIYRDGGGYAKTAIAQGSDWRRIMFFPAEETSDRAVVRRGTMLTNARIEGSLWQLTGETTQISNGTITSDLLLPGTPQLQINKTRLFQEQ